MPFKKLVEPFKRLFESKPDSKAPSRVPSDIRDIVDPSAPAGSYYDYVLVTGLDEGPGGELGAFALANGKSGDVNRWPLPRKHGEPKARWFANGTAGILRSIGPESKVVEFPERPKGDNLFHFAFQDVTDKREAPTRVDPTSEFAPQTDVSTTPRPTELNRPELMSDLVEDVFDPSFEPKRKGSVRVSAFSRMAGRAERIQALKQKYPNRDVDALAALDPTQNGAYIEWLVEKVGLPDASLPELLKEYDSLKKRKLLDASQGDIKRLDVEGLKATVTSGRQKAQQKEESDYYEQRGRLVERNIQQLALAEETRKKELGERKQTQGDSFTEGAFTFRRLHSQKEIAAVSPGNWCVGRLDHPESFRTYTAEPDPEFYFITTSEEDERAPWLLFLSGGPHNGECKDRSDVPVANKDLIETVQKVFNVRVMGGAGAEAERHAEKVRMLKEPYALAILARSRDPMELSAIASNPHTPPRILAALARHPDATVRRTLLGNPNSPAQAIELAVASLQPLVPQARYNALEHPNTPPAVLTELAKSTPTLSFEMLGLAGNPKAPGALLEALTRDVIRATQTPQTTTSSPGAMLTQVQNADVAAKIRLKLMRNPATPHAAAEELSRSANDRVASTLFLLRPEVPLDELRKTYRELKDKVKDDLSAELALKSMEGVLLSHPRTPPDVLDDLAKGTGPITVSYGAQDMALRAIITHPNVAPETVEALVRVLVSDFTTSAFAAAASPKLSQETLRELAKGDTRFLRSILSNKATPDDVLFDAASRMPKDPGPWADSTSLLEKIAFHPNVSDKTLRLLYLSPLETVQACVLDSPQASPSFLKEVAEKLFELGETSYDSNTYLWKLQRLCANARTPTEVLHRIFEVSLRKQRSLREQRHSRGTHEYLAKNPNTAPEDLTALARSPLSFVRREVFMNPSTPRKVRHWLAEHNFAVYNPEAEAEGQTQGQGQGQPHQASLRVRLDAARKRKGESTHAQERRGEAGILRYAHTRRNGERGILLGRGPRAESRLLGLVGGGRPGVAAGPGRGDLWRGDSRPGDTLWRPRPARSVVVAGLRSRTSLFQGLTADRVKSALQSLGFVEQKGTAGPHLKMRHPATGKFVPIKRSDPQNPKTIYTSVVEDAGVPMFDFLDALGIKVDPEVRRRFDEPEPEEAVIDPILTISGEEFIMEPVHGYTLGSPHRDIVERAPDGTIVLSDAFFDLPVVGRERALERIRKLGKAAKKTSPLDGPQDMTGVRLGVLGRVRDLDVVLVDGRKVRDEVDVDFTMGGNPARYGYVPQGEVWVEKSLEKEDRIATTIHEVAEFRRMTLRHESYEEAHEAAARLETEFREQLLEGEVDQVDVCDAAAEFLQRHEDETDIELGRYENKAERKQHASVRVSRRSADLLPGGLGDATKPKDVDPEQLEEGTRDEFEEHTDDPAIAQEVALDHLTKDPNYYAEEAN